MILLVEDGVYLLEKHIKLDSTKLILNLLIIIIVNNTKYYKKLIFKF